MSKLRVARGRGNQGDWANTRAPMGEHPKHREHNAEVERKKEEKRARKRGRNAGR